MPVLVCHDEVVVECDAERAVDVEAWLDKAMIGGIDVVLNGLGVEGSCVPVEVETRIAKT